jgi:hypothetical protein
MAARGSHGFWGSSGAARGLDTGARKEARTRHGWLSQLSVGGNERSLIPARGRVAPSARPRGLSGAGGRGINGWSVVHQRRRRQRVQGPQSNLDTGPNALGRAGTNMLCVYSTGVSAIMMLVVLVLVVGGLRRNGASR